MQICIEIIYLLPVWVFKIIFLCIKTPIHENRLSDVTLVFISLRIILSKQLTHALFGFETISWLFTEQMLQQLKKL